MTIQELYTIQKMNPAFFQLELSAESIAYILVEQWDISELEGFIRILSEIMEPSDLGNLIQEYFTKENLKAGVFTEGSLRNDPHEYDLKQHVLRTLTD